VNVRGDEYGELIDVIAEQTRYYKTYPGKVLENTDDLSRGRVRISIPELGWFTATQSPWVDQEMPGRGCIVPDVGDWVAVYFYAGDPTRPVYRSRTGEVKGQVPESYTGPESKILYDDGETIIKYDSDAKELSISGPAKVIVTGDAIELNGNDKQFVTWDAFNTAYQSMLTIVKAHVHASLGSPSPTLTAMTSDMSGAKTTTITTGG
jgi:hypothetical protein